MLKQVAIWVNPFLQITSFLIGYKKQLHPHYQLSEGSIS
jgi:hypothetical protein